MASTHYILIAVHVSQIAVAERLERARLTVPGPDDTPPGRGEDPRTETVDGAWDGVPLYERILAGGEYHIRGEWVDDATRQEILRYYGGGHIPSESLWVRAEAINAGDPLSTPESLRVQLEQDLGFRKINRGLQTSRASRVAGLFGRVGRFFRDTGRA